MTAIAAITVASNCLVRAVMFHAKIPRRDTTVVSALKSHQQPFNQFPPSL